MRAVYALPQKGKEKKTRLATASAWRREEREVDKQLSKKNKKVEP